MDKFYDCKSNEILWKRGIHFWRSSRLAIIFRIFSIISKWECLPKLWLSKLPCIILILRMDMHAGERLHIQPLLCSFWAVIQDEVIPSPRFWMYSLAINTIHYPNIWWGIQHGLQTVGLERFSMEDRTHSDRLYMLRKIARWIEPNWTWHRRNELEEEKHQTKYNEITILYIYTSMDGIIATLL